PREPGARLRGLLLHAGGWHRPRTRHRETERRDVRRPRTTGVRGWKGNDLPITVSGSHDPGGKQLMRSLPPILVVDDEPNMRASLEQVLRPEGYGVIGVESAERALEVLATEEILLMIPDARLGGMSGYDLLRECNARWPSIPGIVITAYATPRLAVEAIRAGAFDYLSKPFAPEELLLIVTRCAERHRLMRENSALRSRDQQGFSLDQIIGESPPMRDLKQLIQTVAPTNATVLILGESGT